MTSTSNTDGSSSSSNSSLRVQGPGTLRVVLGESPVTVLLVVEEDVSLSMCQHYVLLCVHQQVMWVWYIWHYTAWTRGWCWAGSSTCRH
jgi:hypothetical protein